MCRGLCDDRFDSECCAADESVAVAGADVTPQQFRTTLSRNAGLTPSSSKNTSQKARDRPGAEPTSSPSTETFTPPSAQQSNRSTVPGVAAPFADTPSRISFLSVSTASASDARGATLSAMASAIFAAPTLKFILRMNVVVSDDFNASRSAERAPALSDLDREDTLDLAEVSEYIPTEYTLIGPFLRHPTPKSGRPERSSSNAMPVAGSTNAAAAAAAAAEATATKIRQSAAAARSVRTTTAAGLVIVMPWATRPYRRGRFLRLRGC
mmetsp:Transcript_49565/g.105332  ORF Transcript_49565/g.105332 Transcript_49565/m.105332 type:complete len:267 (+) Transcript_49565:1060-1860(+)